MLSSALLKTKRSLKKLKTCIKTNGNENIRTQNLQDATKAVLRGKFRAIQSYLKKQDKSQINNLTQHPTTRERRTKKTQS